MLARRSLSSQPHREQHPRTKCSGTGRWESCCSGCAAMPRSAPPVPRAREQRGPPAGQAQRHEPHGHLGPSFVLRCGVGLPRRWLKGRAAQHCTAREPAQPRAIFLPYLKWHSSFYPGKIVPVCPMPVLSPKNYIYTARLLFPLFFPFFYSIIPWLILPPKQFCLLAALSAYMPVFTSGVNQIIHSVEKTQLWSRGLSSLGPTSCRKPFLAKVRCGNAWSDGAVGMDGARRGSSLYELWEVLKMLQSTFSPKYSPVLRWCVLGLIRLGSAQVVGTRHLPVQKNPRFLLAAITFVCVPKGFALQLQPKHPPDDLLTWSSCQ